MSIKDILSDKEYNRIKEKIEILLKAFDQISLEMVIKKQAYFTQDMIYLLTKEKISKNSIKETKENVSSYCRDNRSYEMINLNIVIGEITELIPLCKITDLEINPESSHNSRKNPNNSTDFVYKDKFIEFQSSFKDITNIYIKEAKLKKLRKIYDNNLENTYILQQKLDSDGNSLYKIINLAKVEEGGKILRYVNKPEIEIINKTEWIDIKELNNFLRNL